MLKHKTQKDNAVILGFKQNITNLVTQKIKFNLTIKGLNLDENTAFVHPVQ